MVWYEETRCRPDQAPYGFLDLVTEKEQAYQMPNGQNLLWSSRCTRQVVDSWASEPMVWVRPGVCRANPHMRQLESLLPGHRYIPQSCQWGPSTAAAPFIVNKIRAPVVSYLSYVNQVQCCGDGFMICQSKNMIFILTN